MNYFLGKSKLILISGGTASGKTIVSKEITKILEKGNRKVSIISTNNYYHPGSDYPNKKLTEINWDSPSSIKKEEMIADVKKILNGKAIIRTKYIFETGEYDKNQKVVITPADIIIIEGIFALYFDEICNMSSMKIFVDADADLRLLRRLKRDSTGRYKNTFNKTFFYKKWEESIKPMHDKYIAPAKKEADIILNNNSSDEGRILNVINYFFDHLN